MNTEVAIPIASARVGLIERMASKYHVEPNKMLATLKATAFKVKDVEISNEQMMALLVVADQYGLNPWTKEIFAFPDKGGIVPVVGVDGWSRIINDHPAFDGLDFEQDAESCTCIIHRKDRKHPIRVTEYMAECKRGTGPWQSHPRRMLRHKALIQCARVAFSFAGIYDEDEAERIIERDVTPTTVKPAIDMPRAKSDPKPESPAPAAPESSPSPVEATDGAAPVDPKPSIGTLKPSQVDIVRAKMKAAGLTDLDLGLQFPGKSLEPVEGKAQFAFEEFAAIVGWIAERQAA